MLEMSRVEKVFYQGQILRRKRRVVQDITFSLGPGETLGLIGPSGAGKSTIGKLAVRLLEPSEGRLAFEGRDITHADRRTSRRLKAKMQLIFQDPQSSLHPRKKISTLLREPLRLHRLTTRSEEPEAVKQMLDQVDLNEDILDRYPAEVSGGEKQRIVIARVMALRPRIVVLDEPTSMLDVSIQANILHLLVTLQQKWNMAYLYISHDMRLVSKLCQRVAVVAKGRIVEQGPVEKIMARPRHPCTQRLIAAGSF
jgi:ABC-type glutathione transport system ATPase component